MLEEFWARGVLYWLRIPREYDDVRQDEWILAFTRLLLGLCCLTAIFRADRLHLHLYIALSLSYLVYSLAIIFVLRFRLHAGPLFHAGIQLADILWAVHLILLLHWPAMAFGLALFLLAGTGFRWGFWESQLANLIFCSLLAAGSFLYEVSLAGVLPFWRALDFIPELIIYLAVAAMIGILAEGKSIRSEEYAITRIVESLRQESGFEAAILKASTVALRRYGAMQVLVAIDDRGGAGSSLYRITNAQAHLQPSPIDTSRRPQYFFPAPGASWRLAISSHTAQPQFRCKSVDSGKIRRDVAVCVPESFLAAHPFRLMLACSLTYPDEMTVRAYILDPMPFFGGRAGLRYLDRARSQAAPALHDLFSIGRLGIKGEAAANGRVARELHDGVIQSLCAISLQVQQLREEAVETYAQLADPLAHIQETVEKEIISLREYTQHLRSFEMDSTRLLGYLAGLATKFQFENGIPTRFVSEVEEVSFQPRVCVELARITQEALVNIRKHSEANQVLVRLGRRNGDWVLNIVDNGRGFGFSGRLSHEELQASGKGPAVIMERARGIRGKVSVESDEGVGSLVEVTFPVEAVY